MFKYLLISKYLRRKLAPLFAALAVTLCTAMVIIVLSVMGGFFDMLEASAQQLTGDVTVMVFTMRGMPHYQALMDELEKQPEVAAATPVVRGFGLLQFGNRTLPVSVEGVRPTELDAIVSFRDTLMWDSEDIFSLEIDIKDLAMNMRLPESSPVADLAAMVIGIEVNPGHRRDAKGQYNSQNAAVFRDVTLTVVPVSQRGALIDTKPKRCVIVNEFKSGMLEIDQSRVYVAFDVLQKMLMLNEAPTIDMATGELTGETTSARAHEILVKSAPGFTLAQTHKAVEQITETFAASRDDMFMPYVLTWEQRHETLLSAVKNEVGMVTFLFVIISIVAVVMVATTFYMIVLEKTRDIGVLRAIGASRRGIMSLFLGYGLVIGALGSLTGLALAAAIVTHLNEIQELLDQWFGWRMWNPQVYFFDRIPDTLDVTGAAWIVLGAILSSVVGVLIPALLAARLNPVEALRYE